MPAPLTAGVIKLRSPASLHPMYEGEEGA